jgi:predicted site-specific integrase-resolvase
MITVFNRTTAALALGISVETIDRYRKMGKLSYRQIGLRIIFTEFDILQFLEACAIPATNLPTNREKLEMKKATSSK